VPTEWKDSMMDLGSNNNDIAVTALGRTVGASESLLSDSPECDAIRVVPTLAMPQLRVVTIP
jgi:hypothetical protein